MIKQPATNSILFEKYEAFATDFRGNLPVWIDTDEQGVPEILKNYEYPVSAWPVVISDKLADELECLTVKLPELMKRLPLLYFKNDTKRIADFYFNGNEMVTEFALICHNKNVDIACRLDLMLTHGGFEVLEANMGSSIGGWQVQSFDAIIRKMHFPLRNAGTADHFESRNTQSIYIRFLVDNILKHAPVTDKEINIYIEIGNSEEDDKVLSFFDDLLKAELKDRGLVGQAYTGAAQSLTLGKEGLLLLHGKCIHAVLIFNVEDDDKKRPASVLRSFIMDKIYLPDHLGVQMLGDKRNLSLLRELAGRGVFSPGENELILKHIPWTAIVGDKKVVFKDRTYNLLELITDQKDRFVIKVARGFQGRNVFVGRFLTAEEWKEAILLASGKDPFVVQEFSNSLDLLAPDSSNKWAPHKLIWGAFGFGKRYGGVWVRMLPVKTGHGVINSATGAVEAIVYEYISKNI